MGDKLCTELNSSQVENEVNALEISMHDLLNSTKEYSTLSNLATDHMNLQNELENNCNSSITLEKNDLEKRINALTNQSYALQSFVRATLEFISSRDIRDGIIAKNDDLSQISTIDSLHDSNEFEAPSNFAPQEDGGRLELDIDERIKFLGLQSDTFQVFLESSTENGKTEHDINDLKSRIDESLFQLKISAQNSLVNVEKNHVGALNAARKDISILQQRCDLEVANKEEMEYRLGDLQLELDQANELCNDTKQSYFDDIDTLKKELEGKETQLQISAEEVKSMKGFQKQTEEQMNYLNEYITTIKTSMEDGSIEYEGIVKEVESLKEKLNQERKSHTNQLSMLQQCLDLAIADRQESESHVEQLLLDLKQNSEHHQHTKQVHHEKLLEKDDELTIKNEAMTSLKKMIQQGKIELGKEMKSHIEEINKLEQLLKSITVEKDDSESRLSFLQLELNQTNNKYDDEKYVQSNKIESLTESLKEKNNELRISVEELSSIKEEMRNGNDKAVIISNRMDDCIEDKKKFGQKIVSLEEALGRAEIELKKEKKYHATEVEDINSSMIKQGKIELGKEMKSHIEEINKLEQHLKSITVEKDDSESRLSLLQLELNQTNNKYDDEKYVQNNKIE